LGALGEQVRKSLVDKSASKIALENFLKRLGVMVDLVTGAQRTAP
jgi:hypothetical protein